MYKLNKVFPSRMRWEFEPSRIMAPAYAALQPPCHRGCARPWPHSASAVELRQAGKQTPLQIFKTVRRMAGALFIQNLNNRIIIPFLKTRLIPIQTRLIIYFLKPEYIQIFKTVRRMAGVGGERTFHWGWRAQVAVSKWHGKFLI